MSNETDPITGLDAIPTQWAANYAFRVKDGLAMISFIVFLMIPMLLALQIVTRAFGLPHSGPERDQSTPVQTFHFIVLFVLAEIPLMLAGKYLWLFCMCRVLDRTSVGPLISYGIPRRISAFDRRFVVRFYRDIGPAIETRLKPKVSAVRLFSLLPLTFVAGALISCGAAYFHLVTDEPRFRWNGVACAFMALGLSLITSWARRQRR